MWKLPWIEHESISLARWWYQVFSEFDVLFDEDRSRSDSYAWAKSKLGLFPPHAPRIFKLAVFEKVPSHKWSARAYKNTLTHRIHIHVKAVNMCVFVHTNAYSIYSEVSTMIPGMLIEYHEESTWKFQRKQFYSELHDWSRKYVTEHLSIDYHERIFDEVTRTTIISDELSSWHRWRCI